MKFYHSLWFSLNKLQNFMDLIFQIIYTFCLLSWYFILVPIIKWWNIWKPLLLKSCFQCNIILIVTTIIYHYPNKMWVAWGYNIYNGVLFLNDQDVVFQKDYKPSLKKKKRNLKAISYEKYIVWMLKFW